MEAYPTTKTPGQAGVSLGDAFTLSHRFWLYCTLLRAHHALDDDPQCGMTGKGWADLFLTHPDRGVLATECESVRSRLTVEQSDWQDTLNAAGVPAVIVRPADCDEMVATVTSRTRRSERRRLGRCVHQRLLGPVLRSTAAGTHSPRVAVAAPPSRSLSMRGHQQAHQRSSATPFRPSSVLWKARRSNGHARTKAHPPTRKSGWIRRRLNVTSVAPYLGSSSTQ